MMRQWLGLCLEWSVVRRAAAYCLIVGSVLAAINHGDVILRDELTGRHWSKIGLTYMVPYLVSTLSSAGAMRRLRRDSLEHRHSAK